ncbi:hypothetical protein P1X14_07440 [Sphingomonas sp. AOB5]|uniref:DUF3617 domain-containing protein n=1 Tax=Sphingomonas sp. AOB5 TaxID=3034017 RepID=UPI0023FA1F1D|nr:hypothetical protein [Sphingomonas sp. AOB5]MDF7775074.1 hypothetical protein [Sphingomonas sp. AOB5]
MVLRRVWRPAVAGLVILIGAGGAAPQRGLQALGTVESGQWLFKETGGGASRICITNASALLQLRHPGAQCTQVVIENSKDVAAVHYTCPGHGYGRTTVTVETGRLVRVETAGVVDGAPFSSELEGRKTGACN